MDYDDLQTQRSARHWLSADTGKLEDFVPDLERETDPTNWPFADSVVDQVLVYSGDTVRTLASHPVQRRMLMAEWVEAFLSGPGIIVIKNAFDDPTVIEKANRLFELIIDEQLTGQNRVADHFAKPGANDRVWNALEKHAMRDPENFARYYANDVVALAGEAWLGQGYQITAQINRVNPGGNAQLAHRDYHLGFMSTEQMGGYPAHVHALSPMLTLQGAIAHCDMPIETGPTLYLPYSQMFSAGYLAFGRPEFQALFKEKHVQLPLSQGDVVFFNPALMHAAGSNTTTDRYRMANLLQISSAFGRAMETVDRTRIACEIFPTVYSLKSNKQLTDDQALNVVAASAEGYPFPTNLDTDPPVDGLAPESDQILMARALAENWTAEQFESVMQQRVLQRKS